MRCPGNGMLMIAKVVTTPLSATCTRSEVGSPVSGSAPRAGKYTRPPAPVRPPSSFPSESARR
ncbi:Uncharacterised protein [Mycobacteroides abscessus subsp. abscessus]|nr:Uncharacterised protein [Mycobacteroides abscessus subsp. abscessus]